ncbi:MAG: hypothetical protein AB7G39_04765 [Alphaproteobacteria bacterium]
MASAVFVGLFLVLYSQLRYPIPYMDHFIHVDFVLTGRWGLSDLWASYGENRPIAMRLMTLADYGLDAGSDGFFILAGLVCLAGQFLLVTRLLRRPAWSPVRLAALMAAAWLLTRAYTLEGWVWAPGAQFYVTAFIACAAIFLASAQPCGVLRIAGATLLAALAAATYGNGVLVFFCIAAIMALNRQIWALLPGIAGLLWSLAFLHGQHGASLYGEASSSVATPWDLAVYAIAWLGGPWSRFWGTVPIGLAQALLLIGLSIHAALQLWRRHDLTWRRLHAYGLGLMLFALGTAVVTALVRVEFGPTQAATPRYGIFLAVGLCGAALTTVPLLESLTPARRRIAAWLGAAAMAVLLCEQAAATVYYMDKVGRLRADWLAILSGDLSEERLRRPLPPDPAGARRVLAAARQDRSFGFREAWAVSVGQEWTGISQAPCPDTVRPMEEFSGMRILGGGPSAAGFGRLIAVRIADRRIVGLGAGTGLGTWRLALPMNESAFDIIAVHGSEGCTIARMGAP